jgi:acyl-CoA thioesterase FadM
MEGLRQFVGPARVPRVLDPEGEGLYQARGGPQRGKELFVDSLRTTHQDLDVVGNVNNVQAFVWQSRATDLMTYSLVPALTASPEAGQALRASSAKVTYLREVFAFEEIQLRLVLERAWARGAIVRTDCYRVHGRELEKVWVGTQRLAWTESKQGEIAVLEWPNQFRAAFGGEPSPTELRLHGR